MKAHRGSKRVLAAAAVLIGLACCSPASSHVQTQVSQDKVIFNPEPKHGPYVVVAVDNHFHDIHPVDDPSIAAHRGFVVKNEGFNLHNFSVAGTNISINLKPGQTLRWRHLGHHLPPGTYHVFCKFHVEQGMRGVFTVSK
ncbi:MAG: Cupredoxin-like domain [Actinomycetota bacterium]|jgi:plastocyanin|nr:Cupredoxin-like domain [Actinomycetota bacterium]